MRRALSGLAALLLSCGALGSAGANMILDGSFELPDLSGTVHGWCSTNVLSDPDVTCVAQGVETELGKFGPWTGNGNTYASRDFTDWGLIGGVIDGAQFGVLQASSSWLQTIPVGTAGQYRLTWWDAGRTADPGTGGDQTYVVKLDGAVMATFSTTSGQPFTPQSLLLSLSSGNHNLRFSGQVLEGDNSAYLDKIVLVPIPEPATTSLFALAGAVFAAWRWHRRRPVT